jgi:hypothetical protein
MVPIPRFFQERYYRVIGETAVLRLVLDETPYSRLTELLCRSLFFFYIFAQ